MSVYSPFYSGQNPPLLYGVYVAAGVTLTDGTPCAFQFDVNGNLKTTGSGGGGGGGAVTQSTGSGTAAGFWTVQLSNGTNYVGTNSNPLFVQGTVTANAGTGTMAVSLASLPALAAGTNTIGSVGLVPQTAGGLSTNVQQALTTSAQVKGSTGQVYGFDFFNPNASTVYIFFYNTTSAPTIGSTTNLLFEKGLPAGAGANVAIPTGIAFGTGIYIAVSTAATSSSAPGSGLVLTTIYA